MCIEVFLSDPTRFLFHTVGTNGFGQWMRGGCAKMFIPWIRLMEVKFHSIRKFHPSNGRISWKSEPIPKRFKLWMIRWYSKNNPPRRLGFYASPKHHEMLDAGLAGANGRFIWSWGLYKIPFIAAEPRSIPKVSINTSWLDVF